MNSEGKINKLLVNLIDKIQKEIDDTIIHCSNCLPEEIAGCLHSNNIEVNNKTLDGFLEDYNSEYKIILNMLSDPDYESFELIEKIILSRNNLRDFIDGILLCPECKKNLYVYTEIFSESDFEEFLDNSSSELTVILSNTIKSCESCETGPIQYNYKYGDPMDNRYFIEMQDEHGIPEILWKRVRPNLVCQGCGNSDFNDDTPYCTRHDLESWYGESEKLIRLIYPEILDSYTKEEIQEFFDFLLEYPALFLKKGLGLKIDEAIEKTVKDLDAEWIKYETLPSILYRGRARKRGRIPKAEYEFWEPPQGLPGHQRANFPGATVLYLSTDTVAIKHESRPKDDELIDLAVFNVIQEDLIVFNMDKVPSILKKYLNCISEGELEFKPEYALSSFIASLCKYHKVNVFKFESTKMPGAINYAFLNYIKDTTLEINKVVPDYFNME